MSGEGIVRHQLSIHGTAAAEDLFHQRLKAEKMALVRVAGSVKGRVSLLSSRGPAAARQPGRASQRSLKPPAQGPPQEPCQAQSSSN